MPRVLTAVLRGGYAQLPHAPHNLRRVTASRKSGMRWRVFEPEAEFVQTSPRLGTICSRAVSFSSTRGKRGWQEVMAAERSGWSSTTRGSTISPRQVRVNPARRSPMGVI
jgi:hypothetical protein